jgi:hypothetical protein
MKPYAPKDANGDPYCERCGSHSFKPQRSTGMKVGIGLLSLAVSPNELLCLGCGAKYAIGAVGKPLPGSPSTRPDPPPRPDA